VTGKKYMIALSLPLGKQETNGKSGEAGEVSDNRVIAEMQTAELGH
jgi:hypothetical protein